MRKITDKIRNFNIQKEKVPERERRKLNGGKFQEI